jgi:hypothetical protein
VHKLLQDRIDIELSHGASPGIVFQVVAASAVPHERARYPVRGG